MTECTVFVQCKVNEFHVKAMVDTGASVTIMHSDLFARVRNKDTQIRRTSKAVVGANGTALQVQGIAEVTMTIGKSVVTHDVLICEDLAQMMLIGVDFLKPHNCAIDFQKGTIRVRENIARCRTNTRAKSVESCFESQQQFLLVRF